MATYKKCVIKRLLESGGNIPDDPDLKKCYRCEGYEKGCAIYQSQVEQWYAFGEEDSSQR